MITFRSRFFDNSDVKILVGSKSKTAKEYDQALQQSQTVDQTTTPWGKLTENTGSQNTILK